MSAYGLAAAWSGRFELSGVRVPHVNASMRFGGRSDLRSICACWLRFGRKFRRHAQALRECTCMRTRRSLLSSCWRQLGLQPDSPSQPHTHPFGLLPSARMSYSRVTHAPSPAFPPRNHAQLQLRWCLHRCRFRRLGARYSRGGNREAGVSASSRWRPLSL